jgi:tetratricopeptide (TPR) repeat protein
VPSSAEAKRRVMGDVIAEARRLKSEAMDARDLRDFDTAVRLLERAIKALSATLEELRGKRDPHEAPGRQEKEVAKQLAHIFGSTGGVLRRMGDYAAAAQAYDAGYTIESPRSGYGIVDSYNLVQRLVARVFLEPRAVVDALEVVGLNVRDELENARQEIARQIEGPRINDEYAAADRTMVLLLLGDSGLDQAITSFLDSQRKPEPYAVEVTLELLEALRERVASVPDSPPELGGQLAKVVDRFKATYSR